MQLPSCSEDIRNQLPQEAKRFDIIDKAWLKIMGDTAKNTNMLEACSTKGRCAAPPPQPQLYGGLLVG